MVMIKVRASGDHYLGAPEFGLYVDGQLVAGPIEVTAEHRLDQWQDFTFDVDLPNGADSLAIEFANDAWGGAWGLDRNLHIDHIVVNGNVVEPEEGTYDRKGAPDLPGQENLSRNGKLVFDFSDRPELFEDVGDQGDGSGAGDDSGQGDGTGDPDSTDDPDDGGSGDGTSGGAGQGDDPGNSGSDDGDGASGLTRVTVRASGDHFNGAPEMQLLVDGVAVGSPIAVTAVRGNGEWQDITFNLDLPDGANSIAVQFLNDAWAGWGKDRNLYVEHVEINGTQLSPEEAFYDRKGAPDIPGRSSMSRNGKLIFDLSDRQDLFDQDGDGNSAPGNGDGADPGSETPVGEEDGAPTANDDAVTVGEDQSVTFDPRINDQDPDGDGITVMWLVEPAHGTVTLNADGSVTYTPAPNFHGLENIAYTVADANGDEASANIVIQVTAVNDDPFAGDDQVGTAWQQPVTVAVLANDGDVDGDPITFASLGPAAFGQVTDNGDGTLTYTPEDGFSGLDSFVYQISDGQGGSAQAEVQISVAADVPPPSGEPAFYVSPVGNDAWSGRLAEPNADGTDGPFASLTKARDAMRADSEVDTTFVRGGDYHLTEALQLGEADSGVTFQAYPGEVPVLFGGQKITNWTEGPGGIWSADVDSSLAEGHGVGELFVDGVRQEHARFPNADPSEPLKGGWLFAGAPASGVSAKRHITFDEGEVPQFEDASNLKMVVHTKKWSANVFNVESIDYQKNIIHLENVDKHGHHAAPPTYSIDKGARFFLYDSKDALDQDGEWLYDQDAGQLLFKAPADFDGSNVTAGQLTNVIRIEGDHAPVQDVTISGFELRNTSGYDADGDVNRFTGLQERGSIHVSNGDRIVISNNKLENVATGVTLDGSKNTEITGNEIAHTAADGVTMMDYDHTGNSHGNKVVNNWIHDIGELYESSYGVFNFDTFESYIAHNLIEDVTYAAIWSGNGTDSGITSRDNIVEYNEIYNAHMSGGDGGAIYWLNIPDWIDTGDIIRYNKITGTQGVGTVAEGGFKADDKLISYGIYLDNVSRGVEVTGNILVDNNKGIMVHRGLENLIADNILINNNITVQMEREVTGNYDKNLIQENVLVFDENAFAFRTLNSKNITKMADFDYNVISMPSMDPAAWAAWQARGFDDNSILDDPLFVDRANGDYRFKDGSPALALGVDQPNLDPIGLQGPVGPGAGAAVQRDGGQDLPAGGSETDTGGVEPETDPGDVLGLDIIINAWGSQAGGEFAHFSVELDGVELGESFVTNSAGSYAFTASVDPAETLTLAVIFDNDAMIDGRDRNLFLTSIEANGNTVFADDPIVTYDRGELDGANTMAGQTAMPWNGAMVFELPADLLF